MRKTSITPGIFRARLSSADFSLPPSTGLIATAAVFIPSTVTSIP